MKLRHYPLLGLLVLAPWLVRAKEPANLALHKEEIRAYIDSGEYLRDITRVAKEATAWLEERAAKGGEKLAIIFDLDETLLSNVPEYLRLDLGLERQALAAWFDSAKCPVVEPVRDLYLVARRLNVHVIYLTGRPEKYRDVTLRNLQAVGCGAFSEFICKPAGWKETAEKFKTAERQKLTAAGYTIIANIGDQESDLAGGYAEKTFKLPNPIYLSK